MEGFNPDQLIKMLQQLHKVAPALAQKTVTIEGVTITDEKFVASAFEAAKKELATAIPYDIKSYDTNWLRDEVIRKVTETRSTSNNFSETIVIENRCCTKDDCPQMLFRLMFINHLKKADDNKK